MLKEKNGNEKVVLKRRKFTNTHRNIKSCNSLAATPSRKKMAVPKDGSISLVDKKNKAINGEIIIKID